MQQTANDNHRRARRNEIGIRAISLLAPFLFPSPFFFSLSLPGRGTCGRATIPLKKKKNCTIKTCPRRAFGKRAPAPRNQKENQAGHSSERAVARVEGLPSRGVKTTCTTPPGHLFSGLEITGTPRNTPRIAIVRRRNIFTRNLVAIARAEPPRCCCCCRRGCCKSPNRAANSGGGVRWKSQPGPCDVLKK